MTRQIMRSLVPILASARRTEEIARDVAAEQASRAPAPALQRSFREQSKHEAMHARAFDAALDLLGSGNPPERMLKALNEFSARLLSDVSAGRLAASMFGLQYVLEGLGAVALSPPESNFARIGDRFVPLRELILHQEVAHRRLGEVWVPRLAALLGEEERAEFAVASRVYVDLAAAVVEAGLPMLEELETDRNHYLRAAGNFLESLDLGRLLARAREPEEKSA